MTARLSAQVREDLERRLPDGSFRPRVLILRGLRPPRAAGPLTADFIALAGGEPFRSAPDGVMPGSAPLSGAADAEHALIWEEVLEFDPQLVLLSLDVSERDGAVQAWNSVEGWDRVEAAQRGRVALAKPGFCGPGADLGADLLELQNLMGFHFWGWPGGGPGASLRP